MLDSINRWLRKIEIAPTRTRRGRILLIASWVGWALTIGLGLSLLWDYENAPGQGAVSPSRWPSDSRIQLSTDRATLIMLAHPHCACTRASIGELARVMAQVQGRVTAHVLFLKPASFAGDWEKTSLWQSAANIPGVSVLVDEDGKEARRFHAMTSGQIIVYDTAGQLLFTGGITRSRGHSGDNPGESAIVSLLNAGTAEQAQTSVFGCPLFSTGSECQGASHEHDNH